MKTRASRYLYQVSEESYKEMTFDGLRDGYMQAVASVMYVLHKEYGFGKARLSKLWECLDDLNHMPAFFGKKMTGQDALDYIRERFEINIEDADILFEVGGEERRVNNGR